jgi:ribosomal-protein-alanine N-acetyltransferase
MIILETSKLYLKTIDKENSQVLYEKIFLDENTMNYAFGQKTFTLEETKKFIYKNFSKNFEHIGFAPVFEKKTSQIVGIAGISKCEELGSNHYEFCFIIAEEFRHKGYASELAEAQILFAKKKLKQNKIYALVHKKDTVSKSLFTKLKMTYEKDITTKTRGDREVYIKKI